MQVVDRHGCEHARLTWAGDRLRGLEVAWPPGGDGRVTIAGETAPHPLFGTAHEVVISTGARTAMSAVDWSRPTAIPAIEHPGLLPGGAGTAILNVLAMLARESGVPALRYAGPYPTAALWQALTQAFRSSSDEAVFTAGAMARAVRVDTAPIPVDFEPAPFERVTGRERVVAQLRERLERVWIGGDSYVEGGSARRLVATARGWAAELWFGGQRWARVAELSSDGDVLEGPTPLPPVISAVVGQPLPTALLTALADLIVELVAAPLEPAVRTELATARVLWGDAGAAAARDDGVVIVIHAALWDRLALRGLRDLALALAEALAPPIALRAQRRMAAAIVER